LIRGAVRAILSRLGFNEWFRQFNIGRAIIRSGYTASDFFAAVTSWIIYIFSILLSIYFFSDYLGYLDISNSILNIIYIYVVGFIKFFIVAILGFILVDGFVEYIYKGAIDREATRQLAPLAEYIRVILYLVVVTFALEQGGINVATLSAMLMPITWGLAAAMIAIVVAQLLRK
ncbi:MAG: hypothetical protein JZD41_01130, partial [Thermoproteus sp.]|nr:hypothetical protein [Thermoproteus sp.]